MPLKHSVSGFITAVTAGLVSFELANINELLQMLALLFSVIIGGLTIFNIFRHRDTASIANSLDRVERRLNNLYCQADEVEHRQKCPYTSVKKTPRT
jgi:hypothetical protein